MGYWLDQSIDKKTGDYVALDKRDTTENITTWCSYTTQKYREIPSECCRE